MEIVLANPHAARENRLESEVARKTLRLFALKLGIIAAWLGIGGFLSWLVHDFEKASGFGQERITSVLSFALFLISGFLVSVISWASYRNASGSRAT